MCVAPVEAPGTGSTQSVNAALKQQQLMQCWGPTWSCFTSAPGACAEPSTNNHTIGISLALTPAGKPQLQVPGLTWVLVEGRHGPLVGHCSWLERHARTMLRCSCCACRRRVPCCAACCCLVCCVGARPPLKLPDCTLRPACKVACDCAWAAFLWGVDWPEGCHWCCLACLACGLVDGVSSAGNQDRSKHCVQEAMAFKGVLACTAPC